MASFRRCSCYAILSSKAFRASLIWWFTRFSVCSISSKNVCFETNLLISSSKKLSRSSALGLNFLFWRHTFEMISIFSHICSTPVLRIRTSADLNSWSSPLLAASPSRTFSRLGSLRLNLCGFSPSCLETPCEILSRHLPTWNSVALSRTSLSIL